MLERLLGALVPIAAACSLVAHPTSGQPATYVSFVDIPDSALRSVEQSAKGCEALAEDLHSWAGYYWFAAPPTTRWQSATIVCTALWPAHSGVDSTLILVRSSAGPRDRLARRVCSKLVQ